MPCSHDAHLLSALHGTDLNVLNRHHATLHRSGAAVGEPFASAAFAKLVELFKTAPARAQVVCFGNIIVFVSQLLARSAAVGAGSGASHSAVLSSVLKELDGVVDVGFNAIVDSHGQASVSREQLAHLWMQLLDTVQLVLRSVKEEKEKVRADTSAQSSAGDSEAAAATAKKTKKKGDDRGSDDAGRVVTKLLSTCMQRSDILMRSTDPCLVEAKQKLVRVLGAGVGVGGTRTTWPVARRCLDFLIRMCRCSTEGDTERDTMGLSSGMVVEGSSALSGDAGAEDAPVTFNSELGALAFPVLLRQCRKVLLQCYASGTTEEGEGGAVSVHALGELRTAQLCFVLEELAQLEVEPAYVEKAELDEDEGWSTSHKIRVTTGRRAHLLLLYPVFCELCILQSLDVQLRLRQVMQIAGVELGLL